MNFKKIAKTSIVCKTLVAIFLFGCFSFLSEGLESQQNHVVKFEFKKLVRDNSVSNLETKGMKVSWRRLNKEEQIKALKLKLIEEAKEILDAKSDKELCEELGDLLEVLDALLLKKAVSLQKVQYIRENKKMKYGGFDEGIYISHCLVPVSNKEQLLWFRKNPEKYLEINFVNLLESSNK